MLELSRMAENVQEPVAPVASLSEFRARKAADASGSTTPPVDKQAPAVSQDGNAEASAPSKQETQEQPKHKKAQTAEERAAELRAAGRVKEADKILADDAEKKEYEAWKAGKADREREAEELRQLRAARQSPPPAAAPPAQATPPAAAPSADPNVPKLKDFLGKPENAGKPYDEVVEEWEDAKSEWRDRQREAKSQQAKQAETVQAKLVAARGKYADFDNALNTVIATPQNLATLVSEFDNAMDVVYHLHTDSVERQRILALSPGRQLAELGFIARNLQGNGTMQQAPPEKPPTPPVVSRTPPPPRSLSAVAPSEAPKGTPNSLSEFRRQKAARQAS